MGASEFYFDTIELDVPGCRICFTYSTDAGHVFTHELAFAFPEGCKPQALLPAAFALGMAELVGYWKAFLTPSIIIRAGALTIEQIAFWENLYTQGLGEFYYVNKVDFRGLVHIESAPDAPAMEASSVTLPGGRALVPFGGGKDSLVTGELLKREGKSFSWFELEPLSFAGRLKELSEVTESIAIGRDVQENFAPIKELVRQGAPNGHVPITAVYLFSAVLAAKAHGFSDVVLSLERSASEGNVAYLGLLINHQYSKSFEFEQLAAAYVTEHIDPGIRVFSLLRPLYELQIVREFARYPQYFETFVSCNRGLKTCSWCGKCAKCAFMFAALSAFLPSATVEHIFQKNLFEDETLLPLYRELIGLGEQKPFDCVGTFEENKLALFLAAKQYESAGEPLPVVLSSLPIAEGEQYCELLEEYGENAIPADYAYER